MSVRTHEPRCEKWAREHEGWLPFIREGERSKHAFTTAPASMLSIIQKLSSETVSEDVHTHATKCFKAAIDGVSDTDADCFALMLTRAETAARAASKHPDPAKKGELPGLTCLLSERS